MTPLPHAALALPSALSSDPAPHIDSSSPFSMEPLSAPSSLASTSPAIFSSTGTLHTVAFPSPSLCPETVDQQQLLASAGLWSHYLGSIAALTQTFRHFTQRTLAVYKQLSRVTPVDSAELSTALAALNTAYIHTHATTLTLYTAHAHTNTAPAPQPPHQATQPAAPAAQPRPRVKAVRSLTTRSKAGRSRMERGRRGGGRASFPSGSTSALRVWFKGHLRAPYPSEKDKARLSKASKMSVEQVANWFVNARMRLWRKYIVEEKEAIKDGAGKEERGGTEDEDDARQAVPKKATRDERMKRRALKRQAEKPEAQVDTEREQAKQPSKKRRSEGAANVLPLSDQPKATPAAPTETQLWSPPSNRRSMVSFAPLLSSTVQSLPALCATLFSTTTSPSFPPRRLHTASAVPSMAALASPVLPLSPTGLPMSFFGLSSEPPPISATSAAYRTATFDFNLPATLTMSMTLPHSLQLPALTDVMDAETSQQSQQQVLDGASSAQQDEVGRGVAGLGMFTPPLSSQLSSRSLRLTFTATQWASLAHFMPAPLLAVEQEQE